MIKLWLSKIGYSLGVVGLKQIFDFVPPPPAPSPWGDNYSLGEENSAHVTIFKKLRKK